MSRCAPDRPFTVAGPSLALLLCLVIGTGPVDAVAQDRASPRAVAAATEEGPSWTALTPGQRAALTPLQAEWPRIDAPRKQKWLEVAGRMPSMSGDERARVQQRMAEWARMSPAERGRARLQFQETRQLSAGDRQERWQAYQSLSPDERQALAAKAAQPAASAPAAKAAKASSGLATVNAKKNTVPYLPPAVAPKPVAPTVVQSRPGATTSLVNRPERPPLHQQAGLPKIAATKGFVDPATLLPKRGPQGAAVASAPSARGTEVPPQ